MAETINIQYLPITPTLSKELLEALNSAKPALIDSQLQFKDSRVPKALSRIESSIVQIESNLLPLEAAQQLLSALLSRLDQKLKHGPMFSKDKVYNMLIRSLVTALENAIEYTNKPQGLNQNSSSDKLLKKIQQAETSLLSTFDAQKNKLEQSEISLLTTLNNIKVAQEDLANLDSDTEQRIIEKTQRLLEEAQRSIQNRVDDGNEAIRTTLQSVRDELDIRANRAEDKIQSLVSKAEFQNKNQKAELKELFKGHEEESTNRIQVKIQQAETLISTLNGLVESNQKKNEEYIELNNSAIKAHAKETREEAIGAIDNATSKSLGEVHQAQSNALALFTTEAQTATDKINGRIDEEVKLFEDKKKEITEILGEISTAYQAGANTRQADEEKAVADEYRKNGLRGMYIAIGVTVLMFSEFLGLHVWKSAEEITQISELGPQWFVLRIMTITLLASPAIYMLKESATHRNKENLYRQRGTQLSSIGAYLDELSPASKSELKKELAANFFSFYDGKTDTSNVPDFIKNMNDAVKVAKSINGQTKTESPQK